MLELKHTSLTLASNTLFAKGDGLLLNTGKRELFHRLVMKGLFIVGRSRPDITPTIAVLSGRVREPNKDGWGKLKRLVKYLNGTRRLHLTLHYDGLSVARWHVNASFAVHPDFRSHSGGTLLLSPEGGGIASR